MSFPDPPVLYKLHGEGVVISPPKVPDNVDALAIFGEKHFSDRSKGIQALKDDQVTLLAPDMDHVAALKRLNHALMFNFLQLVDRLLTQPRRLRAKIDELHILFANVHARLNGYRELQAVDALQGYMRAQTLARRDATALLRKQLAHSQVVVQEVVATLAAGRPEAMAAIETLKEMQMSPRFKRKAGTTSSGTGSMMTMTTVLVADGTDEQLASTLTAGLRVGGDAAAEAEQRAVAEAQTALTAVGGPKEVSQRRAKAEAEDQLFFIRQDAQELENLLDGVKEFL